MAPGPNGSPGSAAGETTTRHQILVAFDGTEESFRALEQAADAAEAAGLGLDVITVLPPVVDAPEQALRYLKDRGIEAMIHTPVGDPATQIARVADDGAVRTIYLGRREGTVGRALGPSVSRRIALHAPVNVLIAR